MAGRRPGARGPRTRTRASAALLAAAALALAGCDGDPSADREASGAVLEERTVEEVRSQPRPPREAPTIDRRGWETDFSIRNVRLTELVDGGPRRARIPAIDDPVYIRTREADRFLADQEPLLVVSRRGRARAYPLRILIRHEIVNTELAGRPIAVTYCPLSGSGRVFDRRLDGRELTFGTTRYLRNSDSLMWDRQTQSWWQHFTGAALVGELTGTTLDALPSRVLSWEDFASRYPNGDVLSRKTGFTRAYGRNPYAGYDAPHTAPFRFEGVPDDRLPPKERVAALFRPRETVAIPFSTLREEGVVNELVGEEPVVVFFDPQVASALDEATTARSRQVGTVGTFRSRAAGRELTFAQEGTRFVDLETGSQWNVTGRAVTGPLAGAQLAPIRSDQPFWFALAAFVPEARIAG